MARRYRKSAGDNFFEELVKVASLIPWWITLPVALLLLYFVPYGTPADVQLQEPSDAITAMLSIFLKAFFKFLVPMALVFGAILSLFTSLKSGHLFKSIQKNGAHQTVQDLSWQDFEFLLSEWFKKQGYSTELTGGGGADGGIDIKLYKDNQLYLVQCKHYKAWKVPVTTVRELYGVMAAEKAIGGFIVTSGRFTPEAHTFIQGKQIELIDGAKLEAILDSTDLMTESVAKAKPESCPKCGSPLTERKGKYGKFFGCTTYPKCDFTRAIK
jgi:restriction system protein